MNQSLKQTLLAATLAVATACSMPAGARPGEAPRIASTTRPMAEFSALEAELATAVRNKDHAGIERLLSGDFEFRSPADATEMARADWLAVPTSGVPAELSGLAVHSFPTLAIVSFTRVLSSGPQAGARSFVVDAWSRQGSNWKLLARYESLLPAAEGNARDIAPTGKG
jgi:hypothetical protein